MRKDTAAQASRGVWGGGFPNVPRHGGQNKKEGQKKRKRHMDF